MIKQLLICLALFGFVNAAFAEELMTFRSELNQVRYQSLIKELRCPKCQNQNLADSNSGISVDLRHQVHSMIETGKTDQEIVDYMVARYGTFVLYRPQNTPATFLLWYGPFILLSGGVVLFVVVLTKNRRRSSK
ncbi:cytochrome c-type biogenesis protein CcmH [Marinomonas posidonica]|uniref:cytochrome c-type biogenesis protein n=1 Tax=Marinomonas posidonica TaxID=936476 RepID=UPI0037350C06